MMDGVLIVFLSAASRILGLAMDFRAETRDDGADMVLVNVNVK